MSEPGRPSTVGPAADLIVVGLVLLVAGAGTSMMAGYESLTARVSDGSAADTTGAGGLLFLGIVFAILGLGILAAGLSKLARRVDRLLELAEAQDSRRRAAATLAAEGSDTPA